MQETSNIGQVGVSSIRIGGMKIEDLPMVPASRIGNQLKVAEDLALQIQVEAVLFRYPTQRVDYLQSRIVEAKHNIKRQREQQEKLKTKILEYKLLITQCGDRPSLRDIDPQIKEIAKSDRTHEEKKAEIGALRRNAAPYDKSALAQQITQFEEGIVRGDEVIQQEHDTIAEFSEVIGQCKARDLELKNLGVRQALA